MTRRPSPTRPSPGSVCAPTPPRKNTVVFPIFRIVGLFKPAYVRGRPERAGEVLAQLATGTITPPSGHVHVSLVKGEVTCPEPAPPARNNEVRDDLWRQSASMVGLAQQPRAVMLG